MHKTHGARYPIFPFLLDCRKIKNDRKKHIFLLRMQSLSRFASKLTAKHIISAMNGKTKGRKERKLEGRKKREKGNERVENCVFW